MGAASLSAPAITRLTVTFMPLAWRRWKVSVRLTRKLKMSRGLSAQPTRIAVFDGYRLGTESSASDPGST